MTIKQFLAVVEIQTKIISVSTYLYAVLFSVLVTGTISWPLFALMTAAVLCVDMGTTGFNSYFDHKLGTDHADYTVEKVKVLVHETVSPKSALTASAALFFIAGVLGLIIASMTSWYILLAGGASLMVGFFYTGGPYPISRTPLGELFAGGFLGSVLFLITYFVQTGELTMEAFLVSLPMTFLIASILTVNNTCDIQGDIQAGRKTLSILLGKKKSEILLYLEHIAAYGITLALIIAGMLPLIMLPFLVFAVTAAALTFRDMHRKGFSLQRKAPAMGEISRIFLTYSLGMCAGLLASILIMQ